jgi:hypothetical protein
MQNKNKNKNILFLNNKSFFLKNISIKKKITINTTAKSGKKLPVNKKMGSKRKR